MEDYKYKNNYYLLDNDDSINNKSNSSHKNDNKQNYRKDDSVSFNKYNRRRNNDKTDNKTTTMTVPTNIDPFEPFSLRKRDGKSNIKMFPVSLKLQTSWNLWIHPFLDDWGLDSYRLLAKIEDVKTFWGIYNYINSLDSVWTNNMFYLFREGIPPIWEAPENIKGSMWSFRILKVDASKSWNDLSMACIGEYLLNEPSLMDSINGISISPKNNTVTIRIWTSDPKFQESSLFNRHMVPTFDFRRGIFRLNIDQKD